MTARKQTKQTGKPMPTREQLLAAIDKQRAMDEARAKERRRPMTPTDLRRIGELIGNQSLNADERRELETLQARFGADRLRRDLGGTVYRTPDGDKYAAGERRATRTIKAQRWVVDHLKPDATARRKLREKQVKSYEHLLDETGTHLRAKRNKQGQTVDVCKDDYIRQRQAKSRNTHNAAAGVVADKHGFTLAQVKRAAERGKWFVG